MSDESRPIESAIVTMLDRMRGEIIKACARDL